MLAEGLGVASRGKRVESEKVAENDQGKMGQHQILLIFS